MDDDVVCRIVRGELPAEVVARTEEAVAFLDHRPLFPGHVLVCPVAHVATLPELPPESLAPLFALVQRTADAMVTALGADGSFVAANNTVSQSVPHLHVHVVPRRRGDGLKGFFWPRHRYAPGEPQAYATLLREALADTSRPAGGADPEPPPKR